MIPLSDSSRPPAEFPAVTLWLIAVNVVVFGLELLGGDEFVLPWSATPAAIIAGRDWPHDRMKTLVPIGPFLTLMSIPAALLIGLRLLIQMLNEVGSLVDRQSGGVAYVAHIAGAVFGAASAGLFAKPRVLEEGGPPWEPTTRFGRHL